MTAIFQKILDYFERASLKHLWLILIVSALLTGICTLNRGLQSDDYIHRQMLLDQESSFSSKINGFFEFLGPSETLPWWTHPELKIKFWRPLSATSHWLDYQWWPNNPLLMHWHNVLWYVLLVCLSFLFFKRLFTKQAPAFLAAFIFCIDFSHFANISWIANRNSLIASVFILSSLIFYLDWKKNQRLSNLLLGAATFILALLSAESSIILIAVILIYEIIFQKNQTLALKNSITNSVFTGPLLYLSIAGFWFSYYQLSGFGSANNSMYFSPSDELLFSLELIVLKLPVFIFGNLFGVEGFYNVFSSSAKIFISIFCGFSVLTLLFLTKNNFKDLCFNFLFFSTIIAFIPVCFVGVVDMRLGIYASIFSSGLLSIILISIYSDKKKSFTKTMFFIILLSSHLVISPSQWINVGIKDFQQEKNSFYTFHTLQNQHPDKDIFVFNYPSPIDAYYFPFASQKNPQTIYVLTNNLSAYELRVVSPNKVMVVSEQGFIFTESDLNKLKIKKPIQNGIYARAAFNGMLPRNFQFKPGDTFANEVFAVEILELTEVGLIKTMQFSFYEENKIFALWDSENKNFEVISLEDIANENKLLTIKNYLSE